MIDLLRSYPDPLKQHDQRGNFAQLRESLPLFSGGFQREQLLILKLTGAESALAPGFPSAGR
jgi:hypothetical protein